MISFKKYGFRSASAFLKGRGIPGTTFDEVMRDPNWQVRKRALLHIECPLRIRDKVRTTGIWYERIVAVPILASCFERPRY